MSELVLPLHFPFDEPSLPYHIGLMHLSDLAQVMSIERLAFPTPWPASAYRHELTQNDLSTYLVLRRRSPPVDAGRAGIASLWRRKHVLPVLGYGGFWLILDQAHISTIAVHPDWRGRGLGEMMLTALIDAAVLRGATEMTLEVRASNETARSLYRKYGFAQVGRRKQYYHDNNEDALIMTTPRVVEAAFLVKYAHLQARLKDKLIQGNHR
jgi:ribosomal-protein-alanine N-acetyltransferase